MVNTGGWVDIFNIITMFLPIIEWAIDRIESLFKGKKTGEEKKAIDIIKAHAEGEAKAVEHVERFMELLAICFANIFTATDPHVVVLGGGLSNFELIYEEMTKRIPKHLLSVAKCPKIIKAKHGDSGGVRGAAFLNIK